MIQEARPYCGCFEAEAEQKQRRGGESSSSVPSKQGSKQTSMPVVHWATGGCCASRPGSISDQAAGSRTVSALVDGQGWLNSYEI